MELMEEVSTRVRALVKSEVVRVFIYDKEKRTVWTLKEEGGNDPMVMLRLGTRSARAVRHISRLTFS